MKILISSLMALGAASAAQASVVSENGVDYTISVSSSLPSTYAPDNVIGSTGPVLFTPPDVTNVPGATYLGLTQSYSGIARSPFEGTSASSRAYDAVTTLGDGVTESSATFGREIPITIARTAFVQSTFGVGSGSFSFLYGSPDGYNTLRFFYEGSLVASFTGGQLTDPSMPTGLGYQLTTISASGFQYDAVQFATTQNSFEFAAVSAVPLPASAPMFGAALLALGTVGYGLKRRKDAAAARPVA